MAALNALARRRMAAHGEVGGPELEAPGGRRYAAGDRVVMLAPGDGRWVTSERAEVVFIDIDRLALRFDDGRQEVLAGDELDADHLDYAYALTVHRNQAATVDRAHVFADGGGRELGYVAMSRARGPSHIYATADDVDQAAEDLVAEWGRSTRQRWVLDTDAVAGPEAPAHPRLTARPDDVVRMAQLRAERDAVATVAPDATARLRVLDAQLRLEQVTQPRPPRRALGRR